MLWHVGPGEVLSLCFDTWNVLHELCRPSVETSFGAKQRPTLTFDCDSRTPPTRFEHSGAAWELPLHLLPPKRPETQPTTFLLQHFPAQARDVRGSRQGHTPPIKALKSELEAACRLVRWHSLAFGKVLALTNEQVLRQRKGLTFPCKGPAGADTRLAEIQALKVLKSPAALASPRSSSPPSTATTSENRTENGRLEPVHPKCRVLWSLTFYSRHLPPSPGSKRIRTSPA